MPSKAPSADMPWEEAVRRVLSEAGGALHYAEIARRIASIPLRLKVGATPPSRFCAKSPFLYVKKGKSRRTFESRAVSYTLKTAAAEISAQVAADAAMADQLEETGALRAFGMYWVRDSVWWLGKPQLLGKQGAAATDVNFAGQVGVYLLHDRERVIYVGRADDTLLLALKPIRRIGLERVGTASRGSGCAASITMANSPILLRFRGAKTL